MRDTARHVQRPWQERKKEKLEFVNAPCLSRFFFLLFFFFVSVFVFALANLIYVKYNFCHLQFSDTAICS